MAALGAMHPCVPSWHTIICETHQHYVTATSWFNNLLEPEIKRIMKVDIGKHGRNNTALGGSGYRVYDPAVLLKDTRLQPLTNQTKKGTVVDPLLKHSHQPLVVNVVKEPLDIGIDYPAESAPMQPLAQFKGGPLWAFATSVTMTAWQKILLIYGRQYLGCHSLHQLVADHRNTERALFPTWFRNIATAHQFCLVSLFLQGCRQVADIGLKVSFEGCPVNRIHTGSGLPVQLRKAFSQVLLIQQAVKISESVFWVFLCSFCYSPQ
jgi:hypothetical protein